MVKEREPPKFPDAGKGTENGSQNKPDQRVTEFGKPSQLNQRHPFVIPRSNQPRVEHHRPYIPSSASPNIQPPQLSSKEYDKHSFDPYRLAKPSAYGDYGLGSYDGAVPIRKPFNNDRTTKPSPVPLFSSKPLTAPKLGKSASTLKSFVDLTGDSEGGLGSATTRGARSEFGVVGVADDYSYIDAAKANENIKALLEGAFEDEDDKPKTRSRKKKLDSEIDQLAKKLGVIGVDEQAGKAASKEEQEEGGEEDDEDDEDDGTVEGLAVKLLPHQIEGVAWMVEKETGQKKTRGVLPKGGILADDMGLGKTIQTIALLLSNPRPPVVASHDDSDTGKGKEKEKRKKKEIPSTVKKGTLVVAPLALIKQWESELESRVERSHRLKVCVYHGAARTKHGNELDKFDVVITTYGTLSSEHGKKTGCFGIHWYRVVLDEAHSVKNRNAKATQAVYALESWYRWCLTGTPLQNNLDELQSLIRFLQIKPYDELAAWREQITRPMNNGRGGLAVRRLQVYLKAFMKRRTKDVLKLNDASDDDGAEGAATKSDQGDTSKVITRTRSGNGDTTSTTKKTSSNGFKITKREVIKVEAEFSPEEWEFYTNLEQRADKSLERMMGRHDMNYASALVLLLRLRQACNHPGLVKGELAQEKDALVGDVGDSQKKNAGKGDDMDNIANMLGGLSVVTKRCDICQVDLTRLEVADGAVRCQECEDDLKLHFHGKGESTESGKPKTNKKKKKQKQSKQRGKKSANDKDETERLAEAKKTRNQRNRPIVIDSDDEEDADGEWIVPEDQRRVEDFGTEDEDADGGGDWIGSEDSETDEEDDEEEESESEEDIDDEDADESCSNRTMNAIQTSTKIRHLMRILKREAEDYKFIVFSVFTSMLDKIEPFLKKGGIGYARYDGGMRNDLREASLNKLRNSSSTRVLLCSLRAGSLGLNLTAASRVVILEPFWNPFIEEQAIDRVHRLNQTIDVKVYKMTIKDTVEERILQLQNRKRELANATIEGKSGAGKLTMKDMMALFGHEAEARWDRSTKGVAGHDITTSFHKQRPLLESQDSIGGPGSYSSTSHNSQTGPASGGNRDGRRRATPPVEGRKREDPVYGRRW
ncbi:hypothetical protein FQN57_004333 [Myotisia sp. PD_48]|nr:hypothetical protein FQN57_004333 [Myotisia sp. PD_48]